MKIICFQVKQFLTILISITGATLLQATVSAQEADGCYMINSSGGVVNLASLCGGTSREISTKPGIFQAKIKRRDGKVPVIDVTFNGKQKFEMLLDTGATQTTITPDMATAIGVVPIGIEKATVASGDVVTFLTGRVASIEVGGAMVKDAMVSIGPSRLLGQNFFGGYNLTIKRDVVEFHPQ